MSSKSVVTVVVPELAEMAVGKDPQVVVQGFECPGRHRGPVELLEKIGASMHVTISFVRTFLSKAIGWGFRTGNGGGLSGTLLTLAVLTILYFGDPNPTPTPIPIPF